jgi:hypothetical protein
MLNRTAGLDQELNSVSIEAQLLFVMSIPHIDRDGLIIGEALPHLGTALPLRPELFPKYEQLISELVTSGVVIRYPTKKGRVLFFPGFRKNQSFAYSREGASVFEAPPGYVRTSKGLELEGEYSEESDDHEEVATNSGVDRDENTLKLSQDKSRQSPITSADDLIDPDITQSIDKWRDVFNGTPQAIKPPVEKFHRWLAFGGSEILCHMIEQSKDKSNPTGWLYTVYDNWRQDGEVAPNVAKLVADKKKADAPLVPVKLTLDFGDGVLEEREVMARG